jgi:hypothetical protein
MLAMHQFTFSRPMFSSGRGAAILVVMMVAVVACGRDDTAQRATETGRHPDAEEQRGVLAHVVEAPATPGEVREYYAGALSGGAEERHGLLVFTQNGSSPSRTYHMTEYQLEFGKQPKRTTSAGSLMIDAAPTAKGEMIYRLDGGPSPKQARTFLKLYDQLYVPKDPGDLHAGTTAYSLGFAASAMKRRVEVYEDLDESLVKLQLRLRIGDMLKVRLAQRPGTSYSLKSETLGTALQPAGSSNEKGVGGAYDRQVFTFRAVTPGSTVLMFDYILPDKQLGQPFTAPITVE